MTSEDSELAGRCKRGDSDACTQLLRRHREHVHRIAFAIVGDHDEAEDVVQEAFVRAHTAISRFDSRQSFGGWIRRITVNCALSALRRQARDGRQALKHNGGPTAGSDPAQAAVTTDLQQAVRRALQGLPPKQRVAMTLFSLEEMDLQSTAEAMGCAVGTVKTHLHRARQKLRQALADYSSDEELL